MSEGGEPESLPRLPHRPGRLYATAMTLLFAPLAIGVQFAVVALVELAWFRMPDNPGVAMGMFLASMAMAAAMSLPFVVFAAMLVWLLAARSPAIALWQVVLPACLSLVLLAWLFRPPTFRGSLLLGHLLYFLLPALATAALCWRLTRRWHSPDIGTQAMDRA